MNFYNLFYATISFKPVHSELSFWGVWTGWTFHSFIVYTHSLSSHKTIQTFLIQTQSEVTISCLSIVNS